MTSKEEVSTDKPSLVPDDMGLGGSHLSKGMVVGPKNPTKGADNLARESRVWLVVLATLATREEKPLKGANPTSATKLKDAWESSEGVKASRGWENLRTHRSPSEAKSDDFFRGPSRDLVRSDGYEARDFGASRVPPSGHVDFR